MTYPYVDPGHFDPEPGSDIDTEAEPPEDVLPDQNIPADWVEGWDDNNASERGSHWEDE